MEQLNDSGPNLTGRDYAEAIGGTLASTFVPLGAGALLGTLFATTAMAAASFPIVPALIGALIAYHAAGVIDAAGEYLGGLAYDAAVSAASAIQDLANDFAAGAIDAADFVSGIASNALDDLCDALNISRGDLASAASLITPQGIFDALGAALPGWMQGLYGRNAG